MRPCLLFLTCADQTEADKIADELLNKKLVSCVKMNPVNSSYLWKNKIEKSKEILLIMDSFLEKFSEIDKKIKTIHSYDTYTFFSVDVKKMNKKALKWINSSLQK